MLAAASSNTQAHFVFDGFYQQKWFDLSLPAWKRTQAKLHAEMQGARLAHLGGAAAGLVSVSTTCKEGEFKNFSELLAEAETVEIDKNAARITRLRKSVGVAAKCLHNLGAKNQRIWMQTLTYRGDNSAWRAEHISRYLDALRKWHYSRTGSKKVRYVWCAELQPQRGVIHYHVVLWLDNALTPPKGDRPWKSTVRGVVTWHPPMWRHGMSNRLESHAPVAYIMKYASKIETKNVGGLALSAHAISPVDASRLPFRINKDGNQYIYTSVDGKNFTKNTLFTSAGVQHNAPILTAEGPMPYANKSGAKVTLSKAIDKAKTAAAAASGLSAAASATLKPGNPYVKLAEVSCVLLCPFAIEALADWGVNQLKDEGDGTFSVVKPSESAGDGFSDGSWYNVTGATGKFPSASSACSAYVYPSVAVPSPVHAWSFTGMDWSGTQCVGVLTDKKTGAVISSNYLVNVGKSVSSCPVGSPVSNGACVSELPTASQPFGDYMQSNYMGKGWNNHLANMTAAIIANGGNVFTDGTSGDITGPIVVPLVSTETKTSVNLSPGTTTEVAPGHVGATDSGTKTTTTTTTATNSYTSGSPSTGGPTVSATQQTHTTTNITNNVTNITNTTTSTETKTDEAPKEELKDLCEKNPEALACAELDTPEQDIPRDKVTISYEYADIFGNGACPADSYLNTHGQSLKVWDWQTSCDHIQDYFRPVLIACCAFAAFVIISAGVKE